MKTVTKMASVGIAVSLMMMSQAKATVNDYDLDERAGVFVQDGGPSLAPMAFIRFCFAYRNDCRSESAIQLGGAYRPTEAQIEQLVHVNRRINRSIRYSYAFHGAIDERWRIAPTSGACADYAVTKRHELIKLGWSASALRLAEVIVEDGQHHLVLVARTAAGDLVLDSRTEVIRTASRTGYVWVKIQSPDNPRVWRNVAFNHLVADLQSPRQ